MNINAGTAKGSIAAAAQLIGAKTGHASGQASRLYASDWVVNETITVGDAGTSYSVITDRLPVIPGTVSLTFGAEVFTDAGTAVDATTGTLTGSVSGGSGTITYATGVIALTTATSKAASVTLYGTYRFNVERDTAGIGTLDIEVVSSNVDAQVFPLRLNYTVFSAKMRRSLSQIKVCEFGGSLKIKYASYN